MEKNIDPKDLIYFTNAEFSTIVKETEREFAPKSIKDIEKKTMTEEQKTELLNMDIQQSHRLTIFRYMNEKNGMEIVSEDIKMKHKARTESNQAEKQQTNPNQEKQINKTQTNLKNATSSIAQNVKNAAKGLNID